MEFVKCNLCGGQDYKRLFFAQDNLFPTEEKFQLVKCSQCGLVFLNPHPFSFEIEQHYPYEYFHRAKNIEQEEEGNSAQEKKVKIVERLKKGRRVLDIGCGKGEFLYKMQNKGWEVFGVEASPIISTCTREKLGIKHIYNQDLLNLTLPEDFFDVVTLWHVIEHLPDPLGTLKKINRLLKEDGALIIDCPNFNSLTRRVFREKWYPLDLPRHFYQFTPKTLKRMLELIGFVVEGINYKSFPIHNMCCLKLSILLWLSLERPLKQTLDTAPQRINNLRKMFLWKLVRGVFNFGCLVTSMILALLKCGDDICIWARKGSE